MYYKILNKKRREILPLFKQIRSNFYLAEGTGLALLIGHRDSIDFDFFSSDKFSTEKIFNYFKNKNKHKVIKTQEEKDTLSIQINKEINVSFFFHPYKLLKKPHDEKNLRIASINDIGAMKLNAITGRASIKDYVDLYYILKEIKLKKLIKQTTEKYPNINTQLVLKSLVYFKDIKEEPILFKKDKKVEQKEIENFLKEKVAETQRDF